jgi:hypothetical protein
MASFCTAAPPRRKAVRRAIQASEASVRALAWRYGISPTTVQKWCFADLHYRCPDGTKGVAKQSPPRLNGMQGTGLARRG